MQLVEATKDENTGITAKLRSMEISKTTALKVDQDEAPSARAIITGFHKNTEFRFTTEKTDDGILIWRTA
jgi:hypothetical protein